MTSLLKHSLKFKRLRPGPCCSPKMIEQVKLDSNISKLSGYNELPINKITNQCHFYNERTSSCKLQSKPPPTNNMISSILTSEVVDSRPTMCRLFPIWPDLMSNEFDWFLRGPALTHNSYQPYNVPDKYKKHIKTAITHKVTNISPFLNDDDEEKIVSMSVEQVGRNLMHLISFQCEDDNGNMDDIDFETAHDFMINHVDKQDVMSFLIEFSASTKQVYII